MGRARARVLTGEVIGLENRVLDEHVAAAVADDLFGARQWGGATGVVHPIVLCRIIGVHAGHV